MASSLPANYCNCSYLVQVIRVERMRTTALKVEREAMYGITNLLAATTDAPRLLAIDRTNLGH